MFIFNVWSLLEWYLRPLIKWFLRKTTKLCELQRICYGEPAGAPRCLGVEKSLQLSRTQDIKHVTAILDSAAEEKRFLIGNDRSLLDYCIDLVIQTKRINRIVHRSFRPSFSRCIEQIWSYKQLIQEVESLRKTQYDCSEMSHELKLIELWKCLVPHEELDGRITKQWQYIGFQGDDPKTDFRGMGILGLDNLLYFAKEYPQASSHVLSHSHHPKYGYTWAIVGINITSMAYYLLMDGSAKIYMYNKKNKLPNIELFHKFYCYLFYEFDRIWIESKPQNMMEFSMIYKKFENVVRDRLSDATTQFSFMHQIDI